MGTVAYGHRGLFLSLVSLLAVVLPWASTDGWRISSLMAIWMTGVGLRLYAGDTQVKTDCLIFGIASGWVVRNEVADVLRHMFQDIEVLGGSWLLVSRFVVPIVVTALILRWRVHEKSTTKKEASNELSDWTGQYPKPRIFPCQTKHARMFPKRHSFEYSYLQCGFPIIPAGINSEGEAVGGSHDCKLGSWWLRIRAEDYLGRGNGKLGFYGKLKSYLREQVWIVTLHSSKFSLD